MAEPIIGRRSELRALGRFVEAVPAGGRALLIEGEAGIGKTALLHAGVDVARASGFRVLTARSAPAVPRRVRPQAGVSSSRAGARPATMSARCSPARSSRAMWQR